MCPLMWPATAFVSQMASSWPHQPVDNTGPHSEPAVPTDSAPKRASASTSPADVAQYRPQSSAWGPFDHVGPKLRAYMQQCQIGGSGSRGSRCHDTERKNESKEKATTVSHRSPVFHSSCQLSPTLEHAQKPPDLEQMKFEEEVPVSSTTTRLPPASELCQLSPTLEECRNEGCQLVSDTVPSAHPSHAARDLCQLSLTLGQCCNEGCQLLSDTVSSAHPSQAARDVSSDMVAHGVTPFVACSIEVSASEASHAVCDHSAANGDTVGTSVSLNQLARDPLCAVNPMLRVCNRATPFHLTESYLDRWPGRTLHFSLLCWSC